MGPGSRLHSATVLRGTWKSRCFHRGRTHVMSAPGPAKCAGHWRLRWPRHCATVTITSQRAALPRVPAPSSVHFPRPRARGSGNATQMGPRGTRPSVPRSLQTSFLLRGDEDGAAHTVGGGVGEGQATGREPRPRCILAAFDTHLSPPHVHFHSRVNDLFLHFYMT